MKRDSWNKPVTKRLVICLIGLAIIVVLSERYQKWVWAFATMDYQNLRPVEGIWGIIALVGMSFLSVSAIVFFLISGNVKVLQSAIERLGTRTSVDIRGNSESVTEKARIEENVVWRQELERGD